MKLNNKSKTLNVPDVFKSLNNIIREMMIKEAMLTNENTKFMDSLSFEQKIRQLNNWQISELTRDIAYWHAIKNMNINMEENARAEEKQRASNEAMWELEKKIKGGH